MGGGRRHLISMIKRALDVSQAKIKDIVKDIEDIVGDIKDIEEEINETVSELLADNW